MKVFRKILFWLHLIVGVSCAIVVVIMSATGVLLTYDLQMINWADTHALDGGPPAAGVERLGAGELMQRVENSGEGRPNAFKWAADPAAPVVATFGRGKTLYVNAYTGEVLGGESEAIRDFFHGVEDWHRWLAMGGEQRETGQALTGIANLGFLFIVLSGLYLWWPRNWRRKALRSVLWFKRGLSPKARNFNWHNVIGFWSFLPLVLIVGTAVVFSYPWANDLVFILSGETPPAGQGRGGRPPGGNSTGLAASSAFSLDESLYASFDHLIMPVEEHVPNWKSVTLTTPNNPEAPLQIRVDAGTGRQPQKQSQLVFDRKSSAIIELTGFDANSTGRQARTIIRFLHTGEVLGFWGQTLAGLISLGSLLLVWTGLSLSWRRFGSWRKSKYQAKRSLIVRVDN